MVCLRSILVNTRNHGVNLGRIIRVIKRRKVGEICPTGAFRPGICDTQVEKTGTFVS